MMKIVFGIFAFITTVIIYATAIEPGFLLEHSEKFKWHGPHFRIALFSDLHAGSPHINQKYVEMLVERINQAKPDLILMGGDYVINGVIGGRPLSFHEVAKSLGKLKAPFGTFAVLGNHDWWNDTNEIRKSLLDENIRILENDALQIEVQNFKFWLVGIGDDLTGHSNPRGAIEKVTTRDPTILLMHDPASILGLSQTYFLALAGHMHGGQVALPFLGAMIVPGRAPKSWARGWSQLPGGPLFVTKGLGTSILPVRLNAPPEYVIVDLEP